MVVEEQNQNSLQHRVKVPLPEDFCAEITAVDADTVEHGIIDEHLFDIFKVDHAPSEHSSTCEEYVV